MNDINNKIEELEKTFAEVKEQLLKMKEEQTNEQQLSKTQIKNIKQAQKLGFKAKEISYRLEVPYELVARVCHNVNAKENWKKNHGKTNSVHPYANGKRPDQQRGTELWRNKIRRQHQGIITRTLSEEGQKIHDERNECPFCFEDSKKYGQSMEECIRYLDDMKTENGQIWKKDNNYKPFPTQKPKPKQSVIGSVETILPPDVQVQVNGHNLTDDEFEAMDRTDEEISNDANQLLAEDELIQRSENKGLLTKIKNKIQNPHHSAIQRRRNNKDLEKKASELDSATLKRLATMKEAEEARTKGKEDDQ